MSAAAQRALAPMTPMAAVATPKLASARRRVERSSVRRNRTWSWSSRTSSSAVTAAGEGSLLRNESQAPMRTWAKVVLGILAFFATIFAVGLVVGFVLTG